MELKNIVDDLSKTVYKYLLTADIKSVDKEFQKIEEYVESLFYDVSETKFTTIINKTLLRPLRQRILDLNSNRNLILKRDKKHLLLIEELEIQRKYFIDTYSEQLKNSISYEEYSNNRETRIIKKRNFLINLDDIDYDTLYSICSKSEFENILSESFLEVTSYFDDLFKSPDNIKHANQVLFNYVKKLKNTIQALDKTLNKLDLSKDNVLEWLDIIIKQEDIIVFKRNLSFHFKTLINLENHFHQTYLFLNEDEIKNIIPQSKIIDVEINSINYLNEHLTQKEASEFLKCSITKLWRLRKNGKLKGYEIGRSILYKKSELEDLINPK